MLGRHHDDRELVDIGAISVGDGDLSAGIERDALAASGGRIEVDSEVSAPIGDNCPIPRSADQCPAALLWDEQSARIGPSGCYRTRCRATAAHPQDRPVRLDADVTAGSDEPEPVGAGASPLSLRPLQLVDRIDALRTSHPESVLRGVLQRRGAGEPDVPFQIGEAVPELVYVRCLEEDRLRTLDAQVPTDCGEQAWCERVRDGVSRDAPERRLTHREPCGFSSMKVSREVWPRRE